MKDATREEAVAWCHREVKSFSDPVFPPPEGWMWAKHNDSFCLTAIFTNTEDADITSIDPLHYEMRVWLKEGKA